MNYARMKYEIDTTTNQQTTNDKQTICSSLLKYNFKRSFFKMCFTGNVVSFLVWCGGGVVYVVWCGVVLFYHRNGWNVFFNFF